MQLSQQKLLFPQEIEVWYVLPAIRKALTLELIKAGKSQKDAAKLLGITEAAVSHYKKNKRAHDFSLSELEPEVRKSVDSIIHNPSMLFSEIMRINEHIKTSGLFCRIHRSKSWTPENCEKICTYGGGSHGRR